MIDETRRRTRGVYEFEELQVGVQQSMSENRGEKDENKSRYRTCSDLSKDWRLIVPPQ